MNTLRFLMKGYKIGKMLETEYSNVLLLIIILISNSYNVCQMIVKLFHTLIRFFVGNKNKLKYLVLKEI